MTAAKTAKSKKADKKIQWSKVLRGNVSLLILIGTVIAVGLVTRGDFFTARNLTNLTRQVCINGVLSVGMTYVILTGGIDLSVGSIAALAGVAAAMAQVNWGFASRGAGGALLSIAIAMGTGMFCGLFNGLLIVRAKIVPFIITLGLMVIARGLSLILSGGAAIAPLGEEFNYLGQGYIDKPVSILLVVLLTAFGIYRSVLSRHRAGIFVSVVAGGAALYAFAGYRGAPVPVLIFGGLALLGGYFLNNTVWGRYVIATGSNREASVLSGVPVSRIVLGVYVLMGLLSGLSGAVLSARLNGSTPTAGELFELDAIAAVVIGGTRLTGGVGTIAGSVLGAFLIGILNNGMSLLNMTEFYQKVIKGLIIIIAVWIDTKGRASRK